MTETDIKKQYTMKIKVFKLIIPVLLPAVLTGCSDGRDPLPQNREAGLQIESCSSRGNGADDGNSRVEDFGIILLDDTGGTYTGVSNPLHVTYGGGWHFPEVTLTETACRLFAFHPFLSIQGQELPVSLTTQTDYIASGELRLDWLNNRADIEMAHLLSLMEFTVDGSDACSLSLDGVPTEGMYDLAGGTLSIKPETGTLISGGNRLLLFPGPAGGGKAQIHYRERTYDWYLPAGDLEPGKRYSHALTLDKEGTLILSGVNVRPWEAGGDYTGTIKP